MTINDTLDLVFDIRTDESDKPTLRLFHKTISRDVFELNYRLLSSVFSEIWSQGSFHAMSVGPRIASMVLKDTAKRLFDGPPEEYDNDRNPASSLLEEIKRLSMVLAPTPSGWEKIPVQSALSRNLIDEEEWQEVESSLVFFTSAYHLARKSERTARSKILLGLLKGQTYSDSMATTVSSQTLTVPETSQPATPSSVPY